MENHVQENITRENQNVGLEKILLTVLAFECDFTLHFQVENLILFMRVLTPLTS